MKDRKEGKDKEEEKSIRWYELKILIWIAEVLRQRKDRMVVTFWNKKGGYDQYMENEYYEYKKEYKK
jgi:hypothetical protein